MKLTWVGGQAALALGVLGLVACGGSGAAGDPVAGDVVVALDGEGAVDGGVPGSLDAAQGADVPSVVDGSGLGDGGLVGDTSAVMEDAPGSLDVMAPEEVMAPGDAVVASDAGVMEDAASVDAQVASDVGVDVSDGQGAALGVGELCFSEILDPANPGPNYDQFAPVVGSHCLGTNHQDILGVEQVVILGDSVTQGTPNDVHATCLDNAHFYRNELSEWLADTFDLDRGDLFSWGSFKTYNCLYDGTAGLQNSGDFHNCSKWGARTDDLISGGGQIPQCFPGYPNFGSDKKTLVFFTMGGNDISKISQVGSQASEDEVAAGYPEAWALAESAIGYLEESMAFLTDPAMFPAGAYVVFANPFEFTDGTGQTSACSPSEISILGFGTIDISDFGIDLAGLAGYGAWDDQSVQEAIVIWLLEQYMRIAVDYQVDLIWLLESFCGHGFVATGPDADTESRCYRGPDAELYFDITCIHPNDAGHHALSELFKAVIAE